MPSAHEQLVGLRQALERVTDPSDWPLIQAWAARVKPLIRAYYPDHLADFERVIEEPRWSAASDALGLGERTGESNDDPSWKGAAIAIPNVRIAEAARTRILAYIEGLLALGDVTIGSRRSPEKGSGIDSSSLAVLNSELLRGWFIGIDGSAAGSADPARLARCHETVRALVRGILTAGGGLVTLVSGDPRVSGGENPPNSGDKIWRRNSVATSAAIGR